MGETQFAEVLFYFLIENIQQQMVPYALTSVFGPPDADLLEDSYRTLWACPHLGDENIHIFPVSSIKSVVSMQPLPRKADEPDGNDLWFVVEKSGLDDTELTGYVDPGGLIDAP